MSLQVIKPGFHTTVQDLGRIGYQHDGIAVSGAMDPYACRIANMIVGNDERCAVLEMTLIGATLQIQADCWLAICGGDMRPLIDGQAVPMWRPVWVKEGRVLTFQYAHKGCRTYVAVAGGLDVPAVMESRSTYVRGQFGGIEGRPLQAGDVIPIKEHHLPLKPHLSAQQSFYAPSWSVSRFIGPHYSGRPVVRVIQGHEFDYFAPQSQRDFLFRSYTVSRRADRMGYHLSGVKLQASEQATEMVSTAVTMGTIQVPPSGEPIILMADRQTIGGYPRIAQVITVDLPLLAQLKPIDRLHFVEVTHRQAEQLFQRQERHLQILQSALQLRWAEDWEAE